MASELPPGGSPKKLCDLLLASATALSSRGRPDHHETSAISQHTWQEWPGFGRESGPRRESGTEKRVWSQKPWEEAPLA